jgi:hypothetical protein
MIDRPQEDEILSQNPLSDDWKQVAYDTAAGVDEMLKKMDLEFTQVVIGAHYTEVVQGGELPTNDFFEAVKRDLETHGKLIVNLHPAPPPEGYDRVADSQTLCAAGLQSPEGEQVLRVFWIGELKNQAIIEMTRATQDE